MAIWRSFSALWGAVLFVAALVTAGHAAASDAKCKPLVRIASLPMTRLSSGLVTVPITLQDRPSALLLDTGGGIRSLSRRVVQELGLHLYAGNIELRDVRGKSANGQVTIPLMTLAGAQIHNVVFVAEPDDAFIDRDGKSGFDGIFAPDLLPHSDLDFDFSAMTFNIFSQDHCDGKVVYWQAPTVAVVPFDLVRGQIRFNVQLDGKQVRALLDTGSAHVTLDVNVAKSRFDVDLNAPDVKEVGKFSDSRSIYRRRFKTLALEGITINNPNIDMIPNLLGQSQAMTGSHARVDESTTLPEMLFGMPILSRLHVYVAYKEHKLYISAAAPSAAPASN